MATPTRRASEPAPPTEDDSRPVWLRGKRKDWTQHRVIAIGKPKRVKPTTKKKGGR